MNEAPGSTSLQGKRLLVVEDEYLVAMDLVKALEQRGAEIVGPAPNVRAALKLIESATIDAAVLDVNLGGELSYPVADALMARGVPILFATGYDDAVLESYPAAEILQKPIDKARLLRELATLLGSA